MIFQRCFRGRGCWQTPRLLFALAIAAGLSSPARAQAPSPAAEAEIDRAEAAWRAAADSRQPISVTLTDASNGKVVARSEAVRLEAEMLQPLLSGGLNALRDKFRTGGCS